MKCALPRSREDGKAGVNTITGVVEAEVRVERVELLQRLLIEVEVGVVQVLGQTVGVVALRDDGNAALRCPTKQNLGRGWYKLSA